MQTRPAEVQRRRSTFSLRKILPAMALVTRVSEAEAGATRLRFRWFRAKSREKKARARNPTPAKKSGQVTTARMAPLRPECGADVVEIADGFHGGGGEDFAGGGAERRPRQSWLRRPRGRCGAVWLSAGIIEECHLALAIFGAASGRSFRGRVRCGMGPGLRILRRW